MGNQASCSPKQNNQNPEQNDSLSVNESSSNINSTSPNKKQSHKKQPNKNVSKNNELNESSTISSTNSNSSSKVTPNTSKTKTNNKAVTPKTSKTKTNKKAVAPKTSKTKTNKKKRKPKQSKREADTVETDHDNENFSSTKLNANNQKSENVAQNNQSNSNYNDIKVCPIRPQQPTREAQTNEPDDGRFSLTKLYANNPSANPKLKQKENSNQNNQLQPDSSGARPGISYADVARSSSQTKNQLNSVSSFCLLCKKKNAPLIEDQLGSRIRELIGNHPANMVTLTFTLQTNGIYHINISLTQAGNYIGCLLATENAISQISNTSQFQEFFKIFVANDEKIVKEKQNIVQPAITLIKHVE